MYVTSSGTVAEVLFLRMLMDVTVACGSYLLRTDVGNERMSCMEQVVVILQRSQGRNLNVGKINVYREGIVWD